MSVRAVSVLSDGTITKTITADPAMIALNVYSGETLFQLTNDDGLFVDDANVVVNESGGFELKTGAAGSPSVPGGILELVAV